MAGESHMRCDLFAVSFATSFSTIFNKYTNRDSYFTHTYKYINKEWKDWQGCVGVGNKL